MPGGVPGLLVINGSATVVDGEGFSPADDRCGFDDRV